MGVMMEYRGILGSPYKPSSWLTKSDDKILGIVAHTSNLSIWKKEDQKSKPILYSQLEDSLGYMRP